MSKTQLIAGFVTGCIALGLFSVGILLPYGATDSDEYMTVRDGAISDPVFFPQSSPSEDATILYVHFDDTDCVYETVYDAEQDHPLETVGVITESGCVPVAALSYRSGMLAEKEYDEVPLDSVVKMSDIGMELTPYMWDSDN